MAVDICSKCKKLARLRCYPTKKSKVRMLVCFDCYKDLTEVTYLVFDEKRNIIGTTTYKIKSNGEFRDIGKTTYIKKSNGELSNGTSSVKVRKQK